MYEILKNTINIEDFSKIGYKDKKNFERKVLKFKNSTSTLDWILNNEFDLVMTNQAFFIKLLEIYNIDAQWKEEQFKILKTYEKNRLLIKKMQIIAITKPFVRQNENLIALSCFSEKKKVKYELKEIVMLSKKELFKKIFTLIKLHYQKNEGVIPIFGEILKYKVTYDNKEYSFRLQYLLK